MSKAREAVRRIGGSSWGRFPTCQVPLAPCSHIYESKQPHSRRRPDMLRRAPLALVCSVFAAVPLAAQQPAGKSELPRVVLIGDSIRMGYAPLVAKRLEGRAVILSPKPNGGDSANVLKNLDEWAIQAKADVIHFNCGLHDLKLFKKDKTYQVDLEKYEANLRQIVERLRKETK